MSRTRIERLELTGRAFAWAAGLLIFALAFLLFRDVYARILRPPPFEYTAEIYTPERGMLCPGDTLRWQAALRVRAAPTVLYSNQTVWSVALGRTVIPSRAPNIYIWTEAEQGQSVARAAHYLVPVLPPGGYEVRVAASGMNTDADAYKVPFEISKKCVTQEKR